MWLKVIILRLLSRKKNRRERGSKLKKRLRQKSKDIGHSLSWHKKVMKNRKDKTLKKRQPEIQKSKRRVQRRVSGNFLKKSRVKGRAKVGWETQQPCPSALLWVAQNRGKTKGKGRPAAVCV